MQLIATEISDRRRSVAMVAFKRQNETRALGSTRHKWQGNKCRKESSQELYLGGGQDVRDMPFKVVQDFM